MADPEKAQIAKVVKLLAFHRDLLDKLEAVAAEMDDILDGKAGVGQRMKLFEERYKATWATRYPGEYVFTPTRDRPALKRLMKILSDEEIYTRVWNYLKSDDAFYVKVRHNFAVFAASINSHANLLPPAEETSCPHTPECRTRWTCHHLRIAEQSGDATIIAAARRMAQ